jgi:hypothetical protein
VAKGVLAGAWPLSASLPVMQVIGRLRVELVDAE